MDIMTRNVMPMTRTAVASHRSLLTTRNTPAVKAMDIILRAIPSKGKAKVRALRAKLMSPN